MKKFLVCLVLMLSAVGQYGYSQSNVGQFLNKVSAAEGVDKVKIGKFAMTLTKIASGKGDAPIMKGIDSMEVLELTDCSQALKQEFNEQLNSMEDGEGYVTLFRVKDEGDNVRIVAKKKSDTIKELVIFAIDDEDSTIVRFIGNIKESDLSELVGKYTH